MKAEDLKTKTVDELKKLLLDQRKAQLNLRFQKSNGTLEKADEGRKVRRAIARIKTFLNAKLKEEAAKGASKKAA
tara:strand:+ start:188 stop:412 length:225 start_codon:yes stop_codon:yes gene_type:complete